jgi:hypothetical protein
MGMGSYAVDSYVIEYDEVKKICPNAIAAIENEKFFDTIGWGSIAGWQSYSDDQILIDEIYYANEDVNSDTAEECVIIYQKLITNLTKSFYEKTGLSLYFDHYDEDNGDRYDNPGDKDGCIFCVNGMVQLTPAGEKYKDIITKRRWTQFG